MEEKKLNKEINPWLIVATFIIFILINLFFYNFDLLIRKFERDFGFKFADDFARLKRKI